jgi:hypothetical protein
MSNSFRSYDGYHSTVAYLMWAILTWTLGKIKRAALILSNILLGTGFNPVQTFE